MEIPTEIAYFILGFISCFIFFGAFTYIVDKDKLKEENDIKDDINKFKSVIKSKFKKKKKEENKKMTKKETKEKLNKMFKD